MFHKGVADANMVILHQQDFCTKNMVLQPKAVFVQRNCFWTGKWFLDEKEVSASQSCFSQKKAVFASECGVWGKKMNGLPKKCAQARMLRNTKELQ